MPTTDCRDKRKRRWWLGVPMATVVEQLPKCTEYDTLFPQLSAATQNASVHHARRNRDWYTDLPTFTTRTTGQPSSLSPRHGPLSAKPPGTITTRPGRTDQLHTVRRALRLWHKYGKVVEWRQLCRKDEADTVKEAELVVSRCKLRWERQQYLQPSTEDLLRMQGFGGAFVDCFVRAWNIVSRQIHASRLPTLRQVIGNGWNCRHALEVLQGLPAPPRAAIELCSGMGPLAWILAERNGGEAHHLRLLVQVERNPALRRLSSMIIEELCHIGVLSSDIVLVQVADIWHLVRDPENAPVVVDVGGLSSPDRLDLSPDGLVALLASHGLRLADTVIVAGPPCNGFAGQNFAPGITGRCRINNLHSYAAVAVSLFLWGLHRHATATAPAYVYPPVAVESDKRYIDGMQSLLRSTLHYAQCPDNWSDKNRHQYDKEISLRRWALDAAADASRQLEM